MMEIILEKYNYWVAIVLMMIGLYIVISRGNLVKTLIGLNLFQTSVFIFYITIGKIAGGTAPILPYPMKDEGDHGGGYGAAGGEGAAHGTSAILAAEQGAHDGVPATKNDLNTALENDPNEARVEAESLHNMPEGAAIEGNDLFAQTDSEELAQGSDTTLHNVPEMAAITSPADAPQTSLSEIAHTNIADAGEGVAQVIYSNPLPHVLILTAIVVGVATTAVGLALAVRIREAYGTIEEDELEASDHLAEFGRAPGAPLGENGAG